MVSPTALTCKHYVAGCTKTKAKILRPENSEKEKNAPDLGQKGRNRVRFGCWGGVQPVRTGGKPEIRTKMHQIAMQHMKKGNRRKPSVFAGFLAGAEGLEPSARGFGVDVGKCSKEQGRAGVAQFFRTNLSREVLVWCFTDLKRKKTPSPILLLAEYSIALVLPITLGISPCPLEGYRGYPVGRPARGQTRRFRCKICRRKAGG